MRSILLGAAVLVLLSGFITVSVGGFYATYDMLPSAKFEIQQNIVELGLPSTSDAAIGTALFFGAPQIILSIWAIPRVQKGAFHGSR